MTPRSSIILEPHSRGSMAGHALSLRKSWATERSRSNWAIAPAGARQPLRNASKRCLKRQRRRFKHLKVKEAIEQATINYRTEILRDALVGGVSHELRTPLASILGSCSVLNQMPAIRNDRRSQALVDAIHDQAGQLDNEICDLLNATRITAKGVRPQLAWTDPTDIVSAALKQKERRLASHWVKLDLAERRSAGPCGFRSGRTGAWAASGKRRQIFADGK